MKVVVQIVRILVGLLFIFSGLVKANDPLGLSYKMQEFFEIWGLQRFHSYTLFLSVMMNAFEVIAGFSLLLGWKIRLIGWLLLILILFFTFLTGYTYITGTPKHCGCFGDCFPITSKTSFIKDVLLTLCIGFLIWQQKHIRPLPGFRATHIAMFIVILFSFGLQWYTLKYLPIVDCLPFRKGNNVAEKMKIPANAVPDSTVITFVYKKNGQTIEFTADKFPADFDTATYEFVSRYDKVVRKGKNYEPPIKGFALRGKTQEDSTHVILAQPQAILIFIEKFSKAGESWKQGLGKLYKAARSKNIPVYLITAEPAKAEQEIASTSFNQIQIFSCDHKVIETAARAPVCVYVLENGTIKGKWSSSRIKTVIRFINRM